VQPAEVSKMQFQLTSGTILCAKFKDHQHHTTNLTALKMDLRSSQKVATSKEDIKIA
jgi:hypothetical protein